MGIYYGESAPISKEDWEKVVPPRGVTITGINTATYYQEIYEMGVIDEEDGSVVVEEDDGYPD
jgi:hypothetical protein